MMKRQRQQPEQNELERIPKHPHNAQLTSGPFSADGTWNDFWVETLKYLKRVQFWKLSCVSKSLFTLTWDLLIPNSECDHIFSEQYPVDMTRCLSRVQTLKRLYLTDFESYEVVNLLTSLKNLSFLALSSSWLRDPFPVESISHLTSLTALEQLPKHEENHDNTLALLDLVEPNLKHLKTLFANLTVLERIHQMTGLESLVALAETKEYDFGLSRLTRLTHLRCKQANALGLDQLTGLTHLEIHPIAPRVPVLSALTNLRTLRILDDPESSCLSVVTQHLTKLEEFEIHRSFSHRPAFLPSIISLKNLKKLTLQTCYLDVQNIEIWGTCEEFTTVEPYYEDQLDYDLVTALSKRHWPKLKSLTTQTDHFEAFHGMTNLEELSVALREFGDFAFDLGPCTKIHSLKLDFWECPGYQLQHLVSLAPSLTSLTLKSKVTNVKPGESKPEVQGIKDLTFLTNLVSLILHPTSFNEESIKSLVAFTKLQRLEFLALDLTKKNSSQLRVTQTEVQALLRPLFALTRLERLVGIQQFAEEFWCRQLAHQKKTNFKLTA